MAHSLRYPGVVRRILAVCIVAALLTAFSVTTALAHAVVVRSEPPDGGVMASGAQELRLWFSEPILPQATQVRLLDASGQARPGTQMQTDAIDPTLLVVDVRGLPGGIYNLTYSTMSAADGHATLGHLVFTAGSAAAGTDFAGTEQSSAAPIEAILRWLNYLALAVPAGAVAVAYLLLRPRGARNGSRSPESLAADEDLILALGQARKRVLRWALAGALAAAVSGTALLLWQARILTLTADAGAAAGLSSVERMAWVALHTRAGLLWAVRQVLLLAIAALLAIWSGGQGWDAGNLSGRRLSPPKGAGVILGLLSAAVFVTQALSGHAAAVTSGATLPVLADSAHLIAASLWVGGMLALAIGLLPAMLARRGKPAYPALARAGWGPFGLMAALSVGVLIATGLYNSGREVASPDALLITFYGRTLIFKVVLVLAAGAFGLCNSTIIHPGLSAPLARLLRRPAGWTPLSLRRLPALVLAESAVGLLIFLATGVLASSTPANGPEFSPIPPVVPPVTAPSQLIGDLLITFEAKPNTPGQNIMLLQVADTRRPPPAEIMRVIVHFTFLGQDIGTTVADAREISPGLYQLAGNQLSLEGPWQIDVAVRRKRLEDSTAHFQWTVTAPVIPRRPLVVSNHPLAPILEPLAALVLACIVAFAVVATIRRKAREHVRALPDLRAGTEPREPHRAPSEATASR